MKTLRNGLRHVCFDGCMFPDSVMLSQQTWDDVVALGSEVLARLRAEGVPEDELPKIHCSVWPRHVGRGPATDLGEVIPLDTMLGYIVDARDPDGRRFDGIDLIEGVDVSVDMADEDFSLLVTMLSENNLAVGDIVACTWPGPDERGAFGEDSDRARMVDAVDRACRLHKRFEEAGLASYGSIRVDSGEGPASFAEDPEGNQKRLVQTFQAMADKAAEYGMTLVMEGEVCWGGQAGTTQCVRTIQEVDRENFLFQADAAHMVLFLGAVNVDPADSLLPEGVTVFDPEDPGLDSELEVPEGARQAMPEELMAGWKELAEELGPYTASFHFAQSRGMIFGSGAHDKTGQHRPPNDEKGIVDVPAVAALFLLEEAA